MLEKSSSQYDSFLFWRQPIPELRLCELEDVGLQGGQGKEKKASERRGEEGELSQFSSFHYWRAPVVSVDSLLDDLNLLL
ncbi:protein AF1q [Genypterus blacodes]|uniref:protein AF1q n=1 Tax=Genypterus blacodes TaxID=154954 RepID=UPI003F769F6A